MAGLSSHKLFLNPRLVHHRDTQFLPSLFKFDASEGFCKGIRQLRFCIHVRDVHIPFFHAITEEVELHLNVFASTVLTWILAQCKSSLLSTNNLNGLTLIFSNSSTNRMIHIPWQEAAEAAMYSASHDDNATTFCFIVFHVIAEFPMKNT